MLWEKQNIQNHRNKCRTHNGRFRASGGVSPQKRQCDFGSFAPARAAVNPRLREAASTLWASLRTVRVDSTYNQQIIILILRLHPTQIRDFKMKKTVFKFWLLLVFGLIASIYVSCEKDDDKLGNGNNPFVGTWVLSENNETTTFTFNTDKTLHILLETKDKTSKLYSGTYSYSEKDKTMTMLYGVEYGAKPVIFNYVFMSNELVLTDKEGDILILSRQ